MLHFFFCGFEILFVKLTQQLFVTFCVSPALFLYPRYALPSCLSLTFGCVLQCPPPDLIPAPGSSVLQDLQLDLCPVLSDPTNCLHSTKECERNRQQEGVIYALEERSARDTVAGDLLQGLFGRFGNHSTGYR